MAISDPIADAKNLKPFTSEQLSSLKAEYSKLDKIDPAGSTYKKLESMLNNLPQPLLKQMVDADIKFVSGMARNRIISPKSEINKITKIGESSMKKESTISMIKSIMMNDTARATQTFNTLVRSKIAEKIQSMKKEIIKTSLSK